MGVDLHYGYYPKKCADTEILQYLDTNADETWLNGHLPQNFYSLLNEYGKWDEGSQCWVFEDGVKLFEMCSKADFTAVSLSDYITENYQDDFVFIIWKR